MTLSLDIFCLVSTDLFSFLTLDFGHAIKALLQNNTPPLKLTLL